MNSTAYQLLDFGDGQRLEQWGPHRLVRPDPTARGKPADPRAWPSADATYRGEKGKGRWEARKPLPASWPVGFDDLRLAVGLKPYKHTGVFPEQQENWRWTRERARMIGRALTVLNLFAYTGGATVALAKDGHFVTHVDASKPAIAAARENAALNEVRPDGVRWMLEDAPAFVARELRRGKSYDAVVLDPPAFGHSPTGKTWRSERDLVPLLEDCCRLLTERAAFVVLNGYAQHDTPESFERLLGGVVGAKAAAKKFAVEGRELWLTAADGRKLSTGIVARCGFS